MINLRTADGLLGRTAVSILLFHRIPVNPDPLFPYEVCASSFRAKLNVMRRMFNIISLSEAVNGLYGGGLPARAAVITFDDGYRDNFEVALPILKALGVPATFFIATDFLDGGCMWNDSIIESFRAFRGDRIDLETLGMGCLRTDSNEARRGAIESLLERIKYLPEGRRSELVGRVSTLAKVSPPDSLMMTQSQVRDLHAAGMTIGAHTRSHPILALEDSLRSEREICGSRTELESIIDAPVAFFAYPNGRPGKDYESRHVSQVKAAGFSAAVSTATGVCVEGGDRFQLPRFTPWDRSPTRFALRLLLSRKRFPVDMV